MKTVPGASKTATPTVHLPCLQRHSPGGEKLADCNQLEAPALELRHDNFHRLSRGHVDVVHEDNVSVLYVLEYMLDNGFRISGFPIPGIQRP